MKKSCKGRRDRSRSEIRCVHVQCLSTPRTDYRAAGLDPLPSSLSAHQKGHTRVNPSWAEQRREAREAKMGKERCITRLTTPALSGPASKAPCDSHSKIRKGRSSWLQEGDS